MKRTLRYASVLACTYITVCTSYDGERKPDNERKLDGGSISALTTSWGGSSNSQKQFLDTSHLDVIGAKEIEIQLGGGKASFFSAEPGVPAMVGFFHGHSDSDHQDVNIYENPETHNVFGSIVDSRTNEIHQISTNAIGETEIVTRNINDFTDDDDTSMNIPKSNVGFFGRLLGDFPMLRSSSFVNQSPRVLNDDDTFDIMVVWTKKAECKNSGLSSNCQLNTQTRANMLGKINLAVYETNVAFELSGIDTQLRLVHAYLDNSYTEGSTTDALYDISFDYDKKLDSVHENRGKFRADIVSLWVHVDSGCGLGWVGPVKDYMFSVVNWSCATGYFSFGHEIVHNIGCNHDRGTEGDCTNPKPNYGFRDPNGNFRDIMSYNCSPGKCDNIKKTNCARVQRFSNTASNYEGAPIGDAKSDCASHINANAATVIDYFEALTDEELIELGQFQPDEPVADAPTPAPTSADCKKYGARCSSSSSCCNRCKWRRCR